MNITTTNAQAESVTAAKSYEADGRTVSEGINVDAANFMAEAYSTQFRAKIEKVEGVYELTAGEGQLGKTAQIKATTDGRMTMYANGEYIGEVTENGFVINPE
jgi:hypothetical protein